jgi:hypothetical protein
MLWLMFDPRYKGLPIMSIFIGYEQNVEIVKEYDRNALILMLFKCHYTCIFYLNQRLVL